MSASACDLQLVAAADDDFAIMLAGHGLVRGYLRQPPGGVDEAEVLAHVRRLASRRAHRSPPNHWLMVVAGEIVGLCGFIAAPSPAGEVELGYSVAAARRERGYATAAVAALIVTASHNPQLRKIVATTAPANRASQRVLERNGFLRDGTRTHPIDGPLLLWRKTF